MLQQKKKIEAVRKEVEETKKIMLDNIDKLIERGKKIERLKEKSEGLSDQSHMFATQARRLKWNLMLKNAVLTLVILSMALGAAYGFYTGASIPWICVGSLLAGGMTFVLGSMTEHFFHQVQKISLFNGVAPKLKEMKEGGKIHLPDVPYSPIFQRTRGRLKMHNESQQKALSRQKHRPG